MKKLLIITLLLSLNTFADVKVGIVNIQKVITTINEGKDVMKTLKKSFESKQDELKKEEEGIKKLQESLAKQDMVLSDKAKAKKQTEIREKIMALQGKTRSYQRDIQQQEAKLKEPILKKLKPIIDEVSKGEKLTLTFEASTSPVVFAENQVEITDKVIQAYNKKHK